MAALHSLLGISVTVSVQGANSGNSTFGDDVGAFVQEELDALPETLPVDRRAHLARDDVHPGADLSRDRNVARNEGPIFGQEDRPDHSEFVGIPLAAKIRPVALKDRPPSAPLFR